MSSETNPKPSDSHSQPPETTGPVTGQGSIFRGIALVHSKDQVTRIPSELLPIGTNLEVNSNTHYTLRFATGDPREEGGIPVAPEHVEVSGADDHFHIQGKSRTSYYIAPTQNQGEFRRYETFAGIPGVRTIRLGGKNVLCTFEYKGSAAGNIIDRAIGGTELVTPEQLTALQKDFQQLGNDDHYRSSSPIAIGVPLNREIANIYGWHIANTIDRQTGEKPTSFAASARFAVFHRRGFGITGVLLTKDTAGLNRIHDLGYFKDPYDGTARKRGPSTVPYGEILAHWFAAMESPQILLDFSVLEEHGLMGDLFTIMHRNIMQLQGKTLAPYELKSIQSLHTHGFDPDARLPQERADLITRRLQQEDVQQLLR